MYVSYFYVLYIPPNPLLPFHGHQSPANRPASGNLSTLVQKHVRPRIRHGRGRATANLTRSGQEVRHRTTDTRLSFFLPTTYPCLLKINSSIPLIHAAILAINLRSRSSSGLILRRRFRSMRFSPHPIQTHSRGSCPFPGFCGFFYLENTRVHTIP